MNRNVIISDDPLAIGAVAVFPFPVLVPAALTDETRRWLVSVPQIPSGEREGVNSGASLNTGRGLGNDVAPSLHPNRMPCLRLLPPPMLSTPLPRIVLQSDPCIGEEGAQPTIHGLVLETTGLAEREERRRGSSCSFGRLVSARGFLIASCPLLSSPALTQRRLPPPFASVTFIPFNSFR